MSPCGRSAEYAAGLVEQGEMERHLAECARCRGEAEEIRRIELALRESAASHEDPVPEEVRSELARARSRLARSNRWKEVFPMAAAAALFAALVLWVSGGLDSTRTIRRDTVPSLGSPPQDLGETSEWREIESGPQTAYPATEATMLVFDQEETWKTFYARHRKNAAVPKIDFSRGTAAVFLAGPCGSSGYSIHVESVERRGDRWRAAVRLLQPRSWMGEGVHDEITAPYLILFFDSPKARIQVDWQRSRLVRLQMALKALSEWGTLLHGIAAKKEKAPENLEKIFTNTLSLVSGLHEDVENLQRAEGDALSELAKSSEAIVAIDPRSSRSLVVRGYVLLAERQNEGGISAFVRAIEIDPTLVAGYVGRATAKLRKQDLHGAILDTDSALRLSPGDADAYRIRGLARHAGGDLAGALQDFTRALELAPPHWPHRLEVRRDRDRLLERERPAEKPKESLRFRIRYPSEFRLDRATTSAEILAVLRKRLEARDLDGKVTLVDENRLECLVARPEDAAAIRALFIPGRIEFRAVAPKEIYERLSILPDPYDRLPLPKVMKWSSTYGYLAGEKLIVERKPIVLGSDFQDASADLTESGHAKLRISMSDESAARLDATAKRLFAQTPPGLIAFVVDGAVLRVAVVKAEQFGGVLQLDGEASAKYLVALIRSGPLPLPMEEE